MTVSVLLDNSLDANGRALLFEAPSGLITAETAAEVPGALSRIEAALAEGHHLAGYLAYELGYVLEPCLAHLLPTERARPLLWFGIFCAPRELAQSEVEPYLLSGSGGGYSIDNLSLSMDRAAYCARFDAVKRYIAAGDIYQLNLTLKCAFDFAGDPLALYADLRRKQPVAHGALIRTPDLSILSASPELFLEIEDGQALSRPMKGTADRGLTLEQDQGVRDWLCSDAKSRAENLMIVDLMRNDLGRVAETGSVRVTDLYTVETYETLHQMTSGVAAKLRADVGLEMLLRSVFSPGSVTGAPKVRAMEIIRELEVAPRGVYTGAIGMLAPDGSAHFNVAIRTLTLDAAGRGEIGIGSGVVHDSQAQAEYDECLLKMRFLTEPVRSFELIETLRLEPDGSYFLLEQHLERLERSAAYFRFPFDREAVVHALEAEAAAAASEGHMRVRLLLHRDGRLTITSVPIAPPEAAGPMRYVFSDTPVDSTDRFFFHKTTLRDLYDGEHARLSERYGCDEVLFVNERGELAEGSRTNIFLEIGGRLLTPALSSGVLAGTLRAQMLASGQAEEAVLTPDDLARADRVFLGNSVRGLLPAEPLQVEAAAVASGGGV
ncbi:MAG: aminodeoxychorismate synthase component I [Hyphomicrobiales bacterium]|nr:aminodeoxychorismate synthase component I [Hyphomicrobiales bacterium]